jgi:UV DNA damage endonuclease
LCCQFLDAPIRFRSATHRYVAGLHWRRRRRYLTEIARDNAKALQAAIEHCHALGIGGFRINSQILPLGTHPKSGYSLESVDPTGEARESFRQAGTLARRHDVRLSFHPDQFVVLNSEHPEVVESALAELEFQGAIAEEIGAEALVLHGGSTAGGTEAALERLARGLDQLSPLARSLIALENDDRQYTPADLLPLCRSLGVPLVYDVHHHRCLPDEMSIAQATEAAASTWDGREPWAHISSPRDGWDAPNRRAHAEYIDPDDFPEAWHGQSLTVDVEAKAKERAVLALRSALKTRVSII